MGNAQLAGDLPYTRALSEVAMSEVALTGGIVPRTIFTLAKLYSSSTHNVHAA